MKKKENIPSYKIAQIKNAASEKDFEFYRFEYFVSDIDHLRHPHRHDHFALFYVTNGNGSHVIDFEDYEIKARRIFLISPGQVHAWKELVGVRGFVILFTTDYFSMTLQNQELKAYPFFNPASSNAYIDLRKELAEHLQSIFRNIEDEHIHPRRFSQNIIRSFINLILFELTREYETSLHNVKDGNHINLIIHDFETQVNKNFKTRHAVADYAKLKHITANYLNTICKKIKGKSAGQIIRDRIILEAKRLLTHSDITIAQIGYDLGFEDNSYFGRFFKKYTGHTPAAFRIESKKETLMKW